MHLDVFDVARVSLWFIAGLISLYFSFGNARVWTSISTGFFLVFVSEAYLIAPWVDHPRLLAMHSIIGTMAMLVITYGFMEYYLFSRTFETGGDKRLVYLGTAGVLLASGLFSLINPAPSPAVIHNIRMVENSCWVFMVIINLDLLRKIWATVKDTPIGPAFLAFGAVFFFIFLWRGSLLYLQVYGWDEGSTTAADYPFRVGFSNYTLRFGSVAASLSLGGTFVYLARVMR